MLEIVEGTPLGGLIVVGIVHGHADLTALRAFKLLGSFRLLKTKFADRAPTGFAGTDGHTIVIRAMTGCYQAISPFFTPRIKLMAVFFSGQNQVLIWFPLPVSW